MANDAMKRMAKAALRVEKMPVGGGGSTFRPGVPIIRFATAPSGGIKGMAGNTDSADDGVYHSEECVLSDFDATADGMGSFVGSDEIGRVFNPAPSKIPGGMLMVVLGVGSNEEKDQYIAISGVCPAAPA